MNNLQIHWDNICKIYFLTKHYLLLSEELSEEFDTFLQPLKEHRDAFDHITRVYGFSMQKKPVEDVEKYREDNMKKAVGHTYRAFFDTADWLSYVCRKNIRQTLSRYTKDQILGKYAEYEHARKRLDEIPIEIAQIRKNKDLSDDEKELIAEVDQYAKILNELLDIHQTVYSLFA